MGHVCVLIELNISIRGKAFIIEGFTIVEYVYYGIVGSVVAIELSTNFIQFFMKQTIA